ncbi:MAG TPA: hypothetical protein VGH49_08715, partial [Xanthobacteraceae bacterium]
PTHGKGGVMGPLQLARREPIHDVHPLAGIYIEVFWADTTLETFGQGRRGLVLVAAPRRAIAKWTRDWPVRYELWSVQARSGYGAGHCKVIKDHTRHFWNLSGTFSKRPRLPKWVEPETITVSVLCVVQLGGLEPPTS